MKYVNNLKELRKKAGYTQDELAKEIGISKRTLAYWEKGENNIKPEKAEELAKLFNVSVAYLLGYTDNKKVYDDEKTLEIDGDIVTFSKEQWKDEYGERLLTNFVRFLIDNNFYLSNTEVISILNLIGSLSVYNGDDLKTKVFNDIRRNPKHKYYKKIDKEYSFVLSDFVRDEIEEELDYYLRTETRSKTRIKKLVEVLEKNYGKAPFPFTKRNN